MLINRYNAKLKLYLVGKKANKLIKKMKCKLEFKIQRNNYQR